MYSSRAKSRLAIVSILAVGVCLCDSAFAQRNKSKFKKGDRVEVRSGLQWQPATVVGVDNFSGWVEARMDTTARTGSRGTEEFPPSNVRTSRQPKPRPVAEAPLRKWTDRSGKFSVEARYEGMNGDRAVLIKSDGKRVEVPSAKLSDADARYLLEQKSAGDSPFQEVGGSDISVDPSPMKQAIWSGAKLVQPREFSTWSYTPPAGNSSAAPTVRANANVTLTEIPDSQIFFEKVEGLYASDDGARVVACRMRGDVHDKEMYLESIDIQKQRAGSLIALPETTHVLDVDPNSNLVMYRPDIFGSGQNGTLMIARFDGGKLSPVQQWEPYSDETFAPSRDIDKAWFVAENRVMTINGHGKALTLWDVSACKALMNIPVGESLNLQLSLSPDRRLMAVIMKDGIALIDLIKGLHLATVEGSGRHFTKAAIRGDNTKLAALSDEGITVWNLYDGTVVSEFYSSTPMWDASLEWSGDYLIAAGRFLFDVERRILLWEYQDPPGTGVTARLQNGRLYAATKPFGDKGKITLVSTAVPHAAVLQKAKGLPSPEALLVVKPGDSVSIEVDIDPSISLADEVQRSIDARIQQVGGKNERIVALNPNGAKNDVVRQMLAESLESAGLKVVDHSDLVVKAICKPQPQQTIRVNVDGRFPPRPEDFQERTITPHASYLEMSLKGQVLWKRGFIAEPHMVIWVQRGETLDQALDRCTKPNVSLFTHAKFSPYVARPGKASSNGAYGVSQFTAHGIVDGRGSGGRGTSFE
jgi:hypothetical protein